MTTLTGPESRPGAADRSPEPAAGRGAVASVRRAGARIMSTIRAIARFAYHLLDDLF
jgi:hypothetical protein